MDAVHHPVHGRVVLHTHPDATRDDLIACVTSAFEDMGGDARAVRADVRRLVTDADFFFEWVTCLPEWYPSAATYPP